MELFEILTESLGTLTVNKLRTALATLGIVIGIGSVIALISLGQATQQSVQSRIESLGSNLLTISPGSANSGAVRGAAGSNTTLTPADAAAIATSPEVTDLAAVSPEYQGRTQITTAGQNTNTQVVGITSVYPQVHNITLAEGNFVTDAQVASLGRVAVIGPTVASNLFPNGSDPVGQTIRVKGQAMTVVGVTESKGGTGFGNQDDIVFIPLTTAQTLVFGSTTYLTSIALQVKSPDLMVDAENQVGYLLLKRHHLNDPTQADFSIFSQQDILNTANQTTGTFTTLLSGIAAISLLVGGIGIMNIMLVTVTERTREIGLRKALGARKKTIITQFLMEAIILTFSGGIIGMVLGILASFIISNLTGSPFILSPSAVVLAIGVSGGIGILFGWYPARRAANLQPIEALRYE